MGKKDVRLGPELLPFVGAWTIRQHVKAGSLCAEKHPMLLVSNG
jgi:hypothetical protein